MTTPKPKPLNMTPHRLRVLRAIHEAGGTVHPRFIADLFPRKHGWTAQRAQQWGCGFAQPMVDRGLIEKRQTKRFEHLTITLHLTAAGRTAAGIPQ